MKAKKPRNYGATESTLTQLRKTRRDILATNRRIRSVVNRVRSLEITVLDLAAELQARETWQQVARPQPKGKR